MITHYFFKLSFTMGCKKMKSLLIWLHMDRIRRTDFKISVNLQIEILRLIDNTFLDDSNFWKAVIIIKWLVSLLLKLLELYQRSIGVTEFEARSHSNLMISKLLMRSSLYNKRLCFTFWFDFNLWDNFPCLDFRRWSSSTFSFFDIALAISFDLLSRMLF